MVKDKPIIEKEVINVGNNDREIKESTKKVAEKKYDVSDYDRTDQLSKGMAITHEQVSDGYVEGTIDGKIDKTNEDGGLISHEGKDIPRKGHK